MASDITKHTEVILAQLSRHVVDGGVHPAEDTIRLLLQRDDKAQLIEALLSDSAIMRYFPSELITCIAHACCDEPVDWRLSILDKLLSDRRAVVRDAAVHAAELWGLREAVHILQRHQHPERWLQDYTQAVIRQLLNQD